MTDTDAVPAVDTPAEPVAEAPVLTEAPAAVPVLQATPSNENVTPETAPAVEEQTAVEDDPIFFVEAAKFADAVKRLVAHVRDGRRAGDADVEATLADVEKHL